jgi:predicted lipid-binding transport protein (Tim44 family)
MVDLIPPVTYIGISAINYQCPAEGLDVPMQNTMIQLLVLAGIAVFLILKLRSVLGTREGFEKPASPPNDTRARQNLHVVEGGADSDILDHAAPDTPIARALAVMKAAEPGFSVNTFLEGARGAYEMILMAFEKGELDKVRAFLSADIEHSFDEAIRARNEEGLTVEATFVGLREMVLHDATFDSSTKTAEIAVRYVGELTSIVRNKAGEIVEGSATEVKKQRDVWTYARRMGVDDPNWQLVATGD